LILKGAALVAIGVPLVVLPAARFVRDVVRSGADGAALGLERSPAASHPGVRRRPLAVGAWLIVLSVVPFAGAAAILAALWFAARDLDAAGTIVVAVLLVVLAGVPGLLGVQLVRAGLLLRRGYRGIVRGTPRLLWVIAVIASVAVAGALAEPEHRLSTEVLVVSVPVAVVALVTVVALRVADDSVAAAERTTRR
jgi:hypothetical protein